MNISQFEHIQDQDFIDIVLTLSQAMQNRVARQFRILQENPLYPSLHFKKSPIFGQYALPAITELWDMKIMVRLFGIGLVHTVNMKK